MQIHRNTDNGCLGLFYLEISPSNPSPPRFITANRTHVVFPLTAFLAYQDLNVISVNYKDLVQAPCYVQAVHNVPLVGKCTKMLLLRLFRLRPDLNLHDLHVVGFSLGAQVAGHVGRLMNGTIQRITGKRSTWPDTFFLCFLFLKTTYIMINKR